MNLSKELLDELITKINREKAISTYIIEKDYYVTKLLKEIIKKDFNFVFKGGTSLSKCYKIINRFSEDIDLNYDFNGKILSKTKRLFINEIIESSAKECCLLLIDSKSINTEKDYNKYEFSYFKTHADKEYIKTNIEIETAFFLDSEPIEIQKANSIIGEYLLEKNRIDLIEKYDLKAFDVKVQSYKRTFIDKIFAICDYYHNKKSNFTSRHLYDLYKLFPLIKFDEEFYYVFDNVKQKRIEKKIGAQYLERRSISEQLQSIINSDFYKHDYNSNTTLICAEKISYKTVIDCIQIIKSKLKGR